MSMDEPAFADHFLQVLYHRFHGTPGLLRQLLHVTVFPVFQGFHIFSETSHRAGHIRTGQRHPDKSQAEEPEDRHPGFQRGTPACDGRPQSEEEQERQRARRKNVSGHREEDPADPRGRAFQVEQLLRRRRPALTVSFPRCRMLCAAIPSYT